MEKLLLYYARVERPSTGSFMTLESLIGRTFDEMEFWVRAFYPGWEVIMCCQDNPDEVDEGEF